MKVTNRIFSYRALFLHWVGKLSWFRKSSRQARGLSLHGRIGYALASPNSEIRIRVYGRPITLRKGTPDLAVAQSSLGDEFDQSQQYLPKNFDGVIVDAGGYIGTAAMRFSEMFPLAKVVTLEPEESNFRILTINTKSYPSIHPVNCALVGIERDWVTMFDANSGEWGFTIIGAFGEGPILSAVGRSRAQTLTQLNLSRVGMLKLDVEGAEKEIFESNDPVLREIPVILVELHDRLVPGCEKAFREFSIGRQVVFDGTEKWYSLAS